MQKGGQISEPQKQSETDRHGFLRSTVASQRTSFFIREERPQPSASLFLITLRNGLECGIFKGPIIALFLVADGGWDDDE